MTKVIKSPWLVWGLGAALFFSEYFGRVAPSVMVQELISTFHVSHLVLGSLAACFYYAYIGMQLPVGILVDRYGPHRLLYSTAFICALGTLLFGMSQHILFAQLGRFIFGFGAAFAFVGTLKLASVWFPVHRFGLLVGLTQGLGMLGAFVGAAPMSYAVVLFGWRITLILVAIVFMILAILIMLIVRDTPDGELPKNDLSRTQLLTTLRIVSKNPQTWLTAIYVGLIYAPTVVFAEFWGVTFLVNTYHVDTSLAALAVGIIFIGWGAGAPFSGWLSDYIKRRRPVMFASAIICFILISIILYVPNLPIVVVFVCLFFYGFSNIGVVIGYAVTAEVNPRFTTGTAIAFTNMASVLFGALLQPVVGWLVDKQWKGELLNGQPIHTAAEFYNAFSLLPISFVLAFLCCLFIRETFCQSVVEE